MSVWLATYCLSKIYHIHRYQTSACVNNPTKSTFILQFDNVISIILINIFNSYLVIINWTDTYIII